MKRVTSLLAACSTLIIPVTATAINSVGTVGGIAVNKGKLSVETRFGYEERDSDDLIRFRQHLDYGFTDYYAVRLITSQTDGESVGFEDSTKAIENRFQIFDKKTDGFDGGFRLTYLARPSQPDIVGLFNTAEVNWGSRWLTRHNVIVNHQIGGNKTSGVALSVRNRFARNYDAQKNALNISQAGVDLFNTIGNLRLNDDYSDQNHQIGIYANQKFEDRIYTQLTYRAGISSSSSNHVGMFTLGRSF